MPWAGLALQTCAGFLAFMAVLNDYGYNWDTLLGLGINWPNFPMICTVGTNSWGINSKTCGFGCEEPPVGGNRCVAKKWCGSCVRQAGILIC